MKTSKPCSLTEDFQVWHESHDGGDWLQMLFVCQGENDISWSFFYEAN